MKLWLEKSFSTQSDLSPYQIWMWPERQDNFGFLVSQGNQALIIDPSTSYVTKILNHLGVDKVTLALTHHHFDHIGGLESLEKYNPKIYCSSHDRSRILRANHSYESIFLWQSLSFSVQKLKGHTQGHISLYNSEFDFIFSGDVLFSLGCGRLFEGTAEDLHKSLKYFLGLPEKTQIFASHEYSLKNYEFLADVLNLPNHQLKSELLKRIETEGKTIPTTVGFEKSHNPFLKCVLNSPNQSQAIQSLSEMRQKRDLY